MNSNLVHEGQPMKLNSKKEIGAATLLTAVILIIATTLVAFLTAKTVLQETKMAANNYRASQAIVDADAAMDFSLAYFDSVGLDSDGDDSLDDDDTSVDINSIGGGHHDINTYFSTINFDNTDTASNFCRSTPHTVSKKSAEITVSGTSDDGIANRIVSQCIGTINIFSDEGPQQPLITRGAVGLTGNYKIVNRVNNTTIWSGSAVEIGNSASASTYIWDHTQERPDPTDITNRATFESTSNPIQNVDIISTNGLGSGVDIVDQDNTLSILTGDVFFEGFFPSGKTTIEALANGIDQVINIADGDSVSSLDNKDGVMWVNGTPDVSMNGGSYGSADHPAALIINGNLNVTGNPEIYGVLYVVGQLDAGGTVKVIGSTIVEGDTAIVPAGEDPVVGTGGVDLTYSPFTQGLSPNGIRGTATVISGSWRDW